MEDKLSSILEEKDKKDKRNHSKLSKCKTQSSSSSISLKNGLKFLPKAKNKKWFFNFYSSLSFFCDFTDYKNLWIF